MYNSILLFGMAQVRILAIEDDPIHAARIEMLLDELGYSLIEVASNPTDALRLFSATKPDLVLMDIDLSSERDGIEVAEKMNAINPVPLIFTTSFTDRETIDRAKATEPYAYLVKPIEQGALQASIELAVFRFAKDHFREVIENDHFSGWSQNLISKDAFFVKTSSCLEKIRYADVLYVGVSADRYCDIVTESRNFTVRTSLKNLEGKLSPYQFVRVHRAYIVNMLKIDQINEQEMTVGLGTEFVPLGSAYKQVIMQRLNIL